MNQHADPHCPNCKAKIPWFYVRDILKGSEKFFDVSDDHMVGLVSDCAVCNGTMVFVLTSPSMLFIVSNERWRAIVADHDAKFPDKKLEPARIHTQPSKN